MHADPVADMLTRIRNGVRIFRSEVTIKASGVCEGIAKILREQGIEPWMLDPNLRKMNDMANSRIRAQIVGTGKLTCPECGDRDMGNKMNKTPWCMKCNVALASKGKKIRGPKIKQHRHRYA